jgi:putative N6-adenine-specific DNA methylase
MENANKIIVTCGPGLAPWVSAEIQQMGLPVIASSAKAVETAGVFTDVQKLNYTLRTANRVLWHLQSIRAADADKLYQAVYAMPWEQYFDNSAYLKVDSFVKNDSIKDARFANLRVKDAIVDRFTEKTGQRPDSGAENKGVVVYLHWLEDQAEIYFDTSGESIAKHGYRKNPWKAPLMENLAAAIVMATEWDRSSHFINPMCGSGTLAIEACLLAIGIHPGQQRTHYAFEHLSMYQREAWQEYRKSQHRLVPGKLPFKIIASDRDRRAVEAAQENAKKAGVAHLIDFRVGDFRRTALPEDGGIIIMNPEYGDRLGEEQALEQTYREVGDFFKQKGAGFTGFIFTGNMQLAKKVGLRTARKIPFHNGMYECRLLKYELYSGTRT